MEDRLTIINNHSVETELVRLDETIGALSKQVANQVIQLQQLNAEKNELKFDTEEARVKFTTSSEEKKRDVASSLQVNKLRSDMRSV